MANIAKFKQIAADVVKMGKEAATEKYGEKEIKAAQDSLRRNAEKIRKRRASEEETSSERILMHLLSKVSSIVIKLDSCVINHFFVFYKNY